MSAKFSLADSAFLCAASALAVELCSAPLHVYAHGVGVTIFGEDIAALNRFMKGDRRAEVEAVAVLARGASPGPLSPMAVDCVAVCGHLAAGTLTTQRGIAALCGFLSHVRRQNGARAEALAA